MSNVPDFPFPGGTRKIRDELSPVIEVWFWAAVAVSTVTTILGTVSNGLVIYFASKNPMKKGPLRYLNTVVKHLAVSDLLYGVLSSPCTFVYWKMGNMQH